MKKMILVLFMLSIGQTLLAETELKHHTLHFKPTEVGECFVMLYSVEPTPRWIEMDVTGDVVIDLGFTAKKIKRRTMTVVCSGSGRQNVEYYIDNMRQEVIFESYPRSYDALGGSYESVFYLTPRK